MAIPYLNFKDNIHKTRKYPKNWSMKPKPFLPILFSIFSCFTIFCVFRFSLILCTAKFWFFIANTLVLVIAADFDSFTSSEKEEHISHDQYEIKNNTTSLSYMTTSSMSPVVPDKKYITVYSATDDGYDTQNILGPEAKKETENAVIKQEDGRTGNPEEESEEKMKDLIAADPEVEEKGFEEDEFSSMSVEELNTRVEEFIRRIHRQIRFQVQLVDNTQNLAAGAVANLESI